MYVVGPFNSQFLLNDYEYNTLAFSLHLTVLHFHMYMYLLRCMSYPMPFVDYRYI